MKCALGWIVAVLLLGLGAWQYSQASEAAGRALQAEERADSAKAQAREDSARAADVEAAYRADSVRWARQSDSLSRELDRARENEAEASFQEAEAATGLEANLTTLRRLVPPPLVPLVDSALVSHHRRERADDEQEAAAQRVLRTMERRVEILEADTAGLRRRLRATVQANASLRQRVAAEVEAKERWRRAARPGFFGGLWENLPKLAVAAAGGAALCQAVCPR